MKSQMNELRSLPWKDTDEYDCLAARTIISAAVLDTTTDIVYTMPVPARHHQIVHAMAESGKPQTRYQEQGFLTSDGFFLRRAPAMEVARRAGQLLRPNGSYQLYSEDLW